jgi:putative salt-induced outer membrane protein YdiY
MNSRKMTKPFLQRALCGLAAIAAFSVPAAAETNAPAVTDSLKETNDVEVARAVEAMAVTEKNEAAEAAEVAETIRRQEVASKMAKKTEALDPWEAFAPPVDSEYDWIQLTSGEWLKGDFKVLYDFVLEFDSDELDLQEFDFEDVRQLRTRTMKTVFVEGEGGPRDTSVLRGVLHIKDNQVVLRRSEYEVSIPRDRVISIAGGKQRERDYWSGSLSLGINARGGNTETADATIQANLKRRTARTRFNLDYLANYSTTDNLETADNQRLNGYHDWFLTGRFYWKTVEGEYYRDPFSNIDGQYSVSTGAGYDIIRTPRTEWTVNAGAGYQELLFVSVEAGEDDSSSSPFFTAGTRFDYELTGDIDILYDYSMRVLNEINGQYTHHMLATISFDLIGDLDLDVSAIWDRVEKPQPAEDLTIPKQDDYQIIVSLAYDF